MAIVDVGGGWIPLDEIFDQVVPCVPCSVAGLRATPTSNSG